MLLLFTNINNRPHKEYVLFSQLWQIMDSKPSEWLWCVVVAIDCHMQREMLLRFLTETVLRNQRAPWKGYIGQSAEGLPAGPAHQGPKQTEVFVGTWWVLGDPVRVRLCLCSPTSYFLFWRQRGSIKSMTVIFSGLCPLQIMLRNFTSVLSPYTLLIMA